MPGRPALLQMPPSLHSFIHSSIPSFLPSFIHRTLAAGLQLESLPSPSGLTASSSVNIANVALCSRFHFLIVNQGSPSWPSKIQRSRDQLVRLQCIFLYYLINCLLFVTAFRLMVLRFDNFPVKDYECQKDRGTKDCQMFACGGTRWARQHH